MVSSPDNPENVEEPGGTIDGRQSIGQASPTATPAALARTYLKGVVDRFAGAFAARECALVTRVVEGRAEDVAEAILVAAQEGSTFVAMATHGRSGFARLALGSVAKQVLKEDTSLLLLIRSA